MSGETATDSNIDIDISAKSLPRSNYQKDFNPGPIIDAKIESEPISSPNSQVENNSASESETSSKAKFEHKKHTSNPHKFSSDSGQDLYPVEIIAHSCTSLPQSDHIEDCPTKPRTEAQYKSENILSPNKKLEDNSTFKSGAGSERISSSISQIKDSFSSFVSMIDSKTELTQELHMSHSVKPSLSFKKARYPIKSQAQVQNSLPQNSLIENKAFE